MQLIRGLNNLQEQFSNCVITIGNFDGFHIGHQRLLEGLFQQAQQKQVPSVLMTFEPQPNEFFRPDNPVPRLMRFREKWQWLQQTPLDYLLCVQFNRRFAAISADDFIGELLVNQLGAKSIIVGDDFRFGSKRAGDYQLLQQHAQQFDYDVKQLSTFTHDGERVSSTRVRETLADSDFALATELLGRPYCLSGQVCYGNQLGSRWGFPTANIHLHRKQVPISGIFVVKAHGVADHPINGVANIGTRPTIDDGMRVILEVHLFDFDGSLYGQHLEIEIIHKLREEIRYDTVDEMIEQIHRDIENAKQYFLEYHG